MDACTFHDTDALQRERRLFEAVENAYNNRRKVVVFAEKAERAVALDRVLWINKQEAFIPIYRTFYLGVLAERE